MGVKTFQMHRAYPIGQDDEIFQMYKRFLALIKDDNKTNIDASLTASNLVVAKVMGELLKNKE